MIKNNLKFSYDNDSDVLYAYINKPTPAKSIEHKDGIVLRLDPHSGKYVGFTIIDYMSRKKRGKIKSIPHFDLIELPNF